MAGKNFNDPKQILEVGSNLFELIEFTLSSGPKPIVFAVNVAKVREVIRMPLLSPCVSHSEGVLGIFNLRGSPVPVIHLAKVLGLSSGQVTKTNQSTEPTRLGNELKTASIGELERPDVLTGQVIVTEFTGKMAGFVVESAKRIRRVGWDKVLPPLSETFKWATGMMVAEGNDFVFILDFEKVLQEIEGNSQNINQNWNVSTLPVAPNAAQKTIYVVDDSSTARRAVCEMLKPLGYRILEFPNGVNVLEYLKSSPPQGECIMISDVEMPQLDGYSLVMRLHEQEGMLHFPVILHSSLSGDINTERAKRCGAVGYVSKFNKREIVEAVAKVFHLKAKNPGVSLSLWNAA